MTAGDVLEVATPQSLAYVLYVGKHPEYGDAILIAPRRYAERPDDLESLFDTDGCYVAFYPAAAATAQGLVKIVGKISVPAGLPPKRIRRAGARSGSTVKTWVVESDNGGDVVKSQLSPSERRLPIGAIWNHEFLVDRLSRAWRPEAEF